MKAILEFDFDDPEKDDEEKMQRMLRADEVFSLLQDIDDKCRDYQKYCETPNDQQDRFVESLREMIFENQILNLWM